MVCKTCKTEFQGSVCPKCGASAENKKNLDQYRQILFDQTEKVVAVLGNSTAQTFISTGVLGNGFAILSNKRVYFKGKCLVRQGRGMYRKIEEKSVDVNDITGTGFVHNSAVWAKIVYTICFVIGIIFLCCSPYAVIGGAMQAGVVGAAGGIIAALIYLIFWGGLYFLFKFLYKRYNYSAFEIAYAGGSIAFDMHWITNEESKEFQREINLLKDKLKSEKTVSEPNLEQSEQILKYNELLKQGIITQEEFEAKKKQLLNL
ncbi:MAG: SHOCT domain-containing protein [Ruminococcus sp.]